MAFSKINIISLAIGRLGKGPVISVDNDTQFSIVSDHFDVLKLTALSAQDWRFATKIQQLSLDVAPPPTDIYQYQFSLPGDYLALRRLIPNIQSFNIYANQKLYSNTKGLTAEYRFDIPPENWPAYFVNYFAYELASSLALAVAHSETYAIVMEEKVKTSKSLALSADAQSHPNFEIMDKPFISVRNSGGYSGSCLEIAGL